MKPSLSLLPLLLAVVFLGGCPDPKMPKVPPQVPEPKANSALWEAVRVQAATDSAAGLRPA